MYMCVYELWHNTGNSWKLADAVAFPVHFLLLVLKTSILSTLFLRRLFVLYGLHKLFLDMDKND